MPALQVINAHSEEPQNRIETLTERRKDQSRARKDEVGEESLVKAPLLSSPQLASLCFWKDLTQQFSFLANARHRQQTKLPRLPGDLFTFWKVWLSPLHPSQHAMHGCLPHQPAGSLNDWVPKASAVHPFAHVQCSAWPSALL